MTSSASPVTTIKLLPPSAPPLLEFLSSIPPPLTIVLVELAPYISRIRQTAEILAWKSSPYEIWFTVAAWWSICLLSEVALRYVLPITLILSVAIYRWTSSHLSASGPSTEQSLQVTLSDLTIIQSLLPSVTRVPLPRWKVLCRVTALLYVPYLLLMRFIPLRVVLGISGTFLLTWSAPWARIIRRTLWRSAWVRWSLYRAWSFLSGEALSSSTTINLQVSAVSPKLDDSIRFLFTVYENQRWWMGLDWTAALLPGERPSWCSISLQPVSPPSVFTLPTPTTVFMSDGKGGRVKRTATWQWEESEWRVIARKEGAGMKRVERPLPVVKEEQFSSSSETPSSSRWVKTAEKIKEIRRRDSVSVNHDPTPSGDGPHHNQMDVIDGQEELSEHNNRADDDDDSVDPTTDSDGWVYGDNKWEGRSSKGGLGKYTRFRRWTRIAMLNEKVEAAGPGDVGVVPQRVQPQEAEHRYPHTPETIVDDEKESISLRERLNAAVRGSTI